MKIPHGWVIFKCGIFSSCPPGLHQQAAMGEDLQQVVRKLSFSHFKREKEAAKIIIQSL